VGVTTDAVHGTTLAVDILDNAEALRESEARYRAVIENVGEGIGFVDPEEQFTFANPAAEGIFGVLPTGLLGHSLRKFTTPEQFGVIREQTRQRRLNEKSVYEIEISRPDGEKRSLLITAVPQFDSQGEFVGTFGVFRDITERKQAEEALWESEAKLRAVFEMLPVGVAILDAERKFSYMNPALESIVDMSGKSLFNGDHKSRTYLRPDGTPMPAEEFASVRALKEQRDVHNVETGVVKEDGSVIWTSVSAVPVTFPDWKVVVVTTDITQRKRAEEALRQYAKQLRVLTARLANAEEGERRRLAQELHDRVGQNLTALSINLDIVRDLLSPELAVRIGPRLEDLLELVGETMEHIRDVMAELRPPVLDDYGLLASLRWYGQRFAQRTGLAIATQGADPTPRLPLATEITLFRIAQEALTNAARHAQAHQVSVTLDAAAGGVRLTIADDGIGFDPELHTQPNGRHAWGLLTMSERAESTGGRLVMDAAPGRGTRVIVEVGSGL